MEEYAALLANHTWDLVPCPPGTNVVTGKWLFRHKLTSNGSLDRYKARWVLRGFTQRPGVDYDETFSPVVKFATVRTVLSLALSRDWAIHQLDVKNAFLHGTLTKTVYCSQPTGFVDEARPVLVCRLNRSLYGLKQALRAWYSRFASYLASIGFVKAKSDTSLFIYRRGDDTVFLLVYVDDIVLTAFTADLLQRTIVALQREFAMKDLGPKHHFLGITAERRPQGLFLHQRQYAINILERAGMFDCKPCSTLVDTQAKLSKHDRPSVADATSYRSLTGALQYLTFSGPDIAYAVQQVCLHMHTPWEPHLTALKRILRYLRGSLDTASYSDHPRRRNSWSTPTPTGLAVQTRVDPPPVTPCFWVPTLSPGPPSGSPSSLAPVLRPSTAPWPTAWQRPPSCDSSSTNSTVPFSAPPSSTAATSAQSTSPPIPCNISARSTWRSTCTSSASVSSPVTFGFSASPPHCSSPTSSPRDYCRVYF
jgi:hypothetical protein